MATTPQAKVQAERQDLVGDARCPVCGSQDIQLSCCDGGGVAWEPGECHTCGARWWLHYQLTEVELLRPEAPADA